MTDSAGASPKAPDGLDFALPAKAVCDACEAAYLDLFILTCQLETVEPTHARYVELRSEMIEYAVGLYKGDDLDIVPRRAFTTALDLIHQDSMADWMGIKGRNKRGLAATDKVNRLIGIESELYETRDDARVVELYDEAMSTLRAIPALLEAARASAQCAIDEDALEEFLPRFADDLETFRPTVEEARRSQRELARVERIESHRKPDVVMEGTRCSVCLRKPARINGMCKKCARANGVVVHGKIGAS